MKKIVFMNMCNRKAWRNSEEINLRVVEHSKETLYTSAHAALVFNFHSCLFVAALKSVESDKSAQDPVWAWQPAVLTGTTAIRLLFKHHLLCHSLFIMTLKWLRECSSNSQLVSLSRIWLYLGCNCEVALVKNFRWQDFLGFLPCGILTVTLICIA